MTRGKRALDLILAMILALVLWPVILLIAIALLITQGRPLLYRSERMRSVDEAFMLWKFRSMRLDPEDSGVTGGDKSERITPIGRILRRTRGDELPQLWNVLRGDISFVGPRPPLRKYVEAYPEIYGPVLRTRPGITGLATLRFHRREERLLATCETAEETDRVYRTRCIPRKAALDLIYGRNRTICVDLALIWETATHNAVLKPRTRRAPPK